MRKFIFLFLPVIFTALLVIFLYLYTRVLVPVQTDVPYLSGVFDKFPDVEWDSAYFQPVYLYGFSKDDRYFLKTAYRNAKGKLKLINILVGGKYGGKTYNFTKTDVKDSDFTDFDGYKSQFKFGQRISVAYFSSLAFSDGWRDTELCKNYTDLCDFAESVFKEEDNRMNDFPLTGDIKGSQTIPALFVSEKLNNK